LTLSNEQGLSLSRKYLFAIISLSFTIFLVYSNSLTAEWQYDDYFNILENANIRLTNFSWENIEKSFFLEGHFSRPVSYFSFALNYYFCGYEVFGYHLVNLLIHLITSLFLFFFIFRTLNLPNLKDPYGDKAYAIALFSTFFWSLHPIQVHAVTTIVQRMACMSGMFYIMAMLFFLNGRLSEKKLTGSIFFLFAFCAAILALGTKENAIMIPVSLFLYDLLLIRGTGNKKYLRQFFFLCALIFTLSLIVSFFFIDITSILEGYRIRPFTMMERLLTETRIIVFYISLLLYPISSRLTLLHNPALSHSLFDPWTTLFSIILISLLIFLTIRWSAKKPLWSFCILFFFLNHIVEGTFIPLELIYEHRNYIPSLFFFIPITLIMLHTIRYFAYNNYLKYLFVFSFSCLLMIFGQTVYGRNTTINTAYGLWFDNIKKAPGLSRAHNNMGQVYWNKGIQGMACLEFDKAYKLNNETNIHQFGIICNNLGNCYFNIVQEYDKAKSLYQKALFFYPGLSPAISGMGLVALKAGQIGEAKDLFRIALQKNPDDPEFLHNMALAFFMEKDFENCISYSTRTLLLNQVDIPALMLLGQCCFFQGTYDQAVKCWVACNRILPRNILAKLALIQLYALTEKEVLLRATLNDLKAATDGKSLSKILMIAEQENPGFVIYDPHQASLVKILMANGFSD
jgi:protein O-mannosyl-transferase